MFEALRIMGINSETLIFEKGLTSKCQFAGALRPSLKRHDFWIILCKYWQFAILFIFLKILFSL
jgi:hypothetical protein